LRNQSCNLRLWVDASSRCCRAISTCLS